MATLLAFTADQVRGLTGLSDRQLRYWDESGCFDPSYADQRRRRPYSRVYSFTDLVALQTLALLRNKHGVPLQELRKVAERLARYGKEPNPWVGRRFWVGGRHVFFEDPRTGSLVAGRPRGQTVIPIDLAETDASRLRERDPGSVGRIERRRHVAHNAWVVADTRIPTSAVWAFHEAGYDADAIVREYPLLRPTDVDAAIAHERKLREKPAA